MLASVNLSDRLAVDVQGAQALRARAAGGDPEALKAAAKQFEAMVVQMMLKTMRQTSFAAEGDVFGDSNNLKVYQELLDQQWAQKMVNSKGLGFAEAIVKRLGVEAASKTIQAQLDAEAEASQDMATKPTTDVSSPAADVQSGTAPQPAPASRAGDRKSQFIESLLPYAQQAEAATGVPARFMLAQAALESGWGKREILNQDGTPSHNLFGIKATGWSGESTDVLTTEYRQGLAMKVTERFRAYADYGEAFTDYAQLLKRRYGEAVAAGEDAAGFANGLVRGGYATDPAYASKLLAVIDGLAKVGA